MDEFTKAALLLAEGGAVYSLGQITSPILKSVGEYILERIKPVVKRAEELAADHSIPPGAIPEKAVWTILEAARQTTDPIETEYLAGVLASSITPDGIDDRGVPLTALLRRLSRYQILFHYLTFHAIWKRCRVALSEYEIELDPTESRTGFFHSEFLEMTRWPKEKFTELLSHCLHGLFREGLIGEGWVAEMPGYHRRHGKTGDGPCFAFTPTPSGAEFFMWGCGLGHMTPKVFWQHEIKPLATVQLPEPLDVYGETSEHEKMEKLSREVERLREHLSHRM